MAVIDAPMCFLAFLHQCLHRFISKSPTIFLTCVRCERRKPPERKFGATGNRTRNLQVTRLTRHRQDGEKEDCSDLHNDAKLDGHEFVIAGSYAWIGLSDVEEEGQYKWMTSYTGLTEYSHWSPGEPNNANSNENCVFIRSQSRGNGWDDDSCSKTHNYVCEKHSG